MDYILDYIKEVASCNCIRGFNIFLNYILEYIKEEMASCHSTGGNKYFYELYFRLY